MERCTIATGIPANVAEDIDRWGMITLLDYQRTSKRHAMFGKLDVRLLGPCTASQPAIDAQSQFKKNVESFVNLH